MAFSHALMKYSKSRTAAQEFLKWLHGKEQYGKWFEIESGYSVDATVYLENHPMWKPSTTRSSRFGPPPVAPG